MGLAAVKIDNAARTPYRIRHSFGIYGLETLSKEEIASLMGNGITVLRRHYLHPDDDTLYKSNAIFQQFYF